MMHITTQIFEDLRRSL